MSSAFFTNSMLAEREQAEIQRSRCEAEKSAVRDIDWDGIVRYLAPPASTIYTLEYAFHLLGDIDGQRVLDLGCGAGENLLPLVGRGAEVYALDVSPELIRLAAVRLAQAGLRAQVKVGSAYATGYASESFDVVFAIAVLHHLHLDAACAEIRRILKPGGRLILSEPIRFSRLYGRLRHWLPAGPIEVSPFEHPFTRAEWRSIASQFQIRRKRYFRLPIVPLFERLAPGRSSWQARQWSAYGLRTLPFLKHWATMIVAQAEKAG